jgi:hypothetical protein
MGKLDRFGIPSTPGTLTHQNRLPKWRIKYIGFRAATASVPKWHAHKDLFAGCLAKNHCNSRQNQFRPFTARHMQS